MHERCFFLMKLNVICNAEDRFSCLDLFCIESCYSFNTKITSLELLRTLCSVYCN